MFKAKEITSVPNQNGLIKRIKSPKRSKPTSPATLETSKGRQTTIQGLPIPKGESPYALAKSAEYKDRDLDSAEYFYYLAIQQKDRIESAVKDLASLLHQRGKTKEACELLEKYKYLFKQDQEKYQNLYNTLRKQIDSTGNCHNKRLKVSNLDREDSEKTILNFFTNPIRIQEVVLENEEINGKVVYYCLLRFNSHSSARKTLEGFHFWDKYSVEWVSPTGELMGDAHYARHKMEEYRKHHPTFDYMMFDRDPHGYVLSLPLESSSHSIRSANVEDMSSAKKLLGEHLFKTIFKDESKLSLPT